MARIPINLSTGTIESEPQKDEAIIVGIDLGTTNSLVAYIKDGEPYILTENGKRGLVPSIIHFAENGDLVIGEEAKQKLITAPERTIYSAKRLMGKSIDDLKSYTDNLGYTLVGNTEDEHKLLQVKIDNTYYNPIQLSSQLLAELNKRHETLASLQVLTSSGSSTNRQQLASLMALASTSMTQSMSLSMTLEVAHLMSLSSTLIRGFLRS